MNNQDLIWKLQDRINDICDNEKLSCLRGIDNKYLVNGRQIIMWYTNSTRKCSIKYSNCFDYSKNFDDLLICSDELMYFAAHLFLYRPFMNNPLNDRYDHGGKNVYPNYQNLEAKRFCMYADIASEKAYNYWDRIGDLIASYFPDIINPHRVFFTTAIQNVPNCYKSSENYLWLLNFKENEYLELNKIRKQIVHYSSSNTAFKYDHLEKVMDQKFMEMLINSRFQVAEFYKKQIDLTITGFEKTLLFLEELNNILFNDIE